MRKGTIILLAMFIAMLLLASWTRALTPMPGAAAAPLAGTGRHIALIGAPPAIVSVTQPFVAAEALKPLRTYSDALPYLREAPPPIHNQFFLRTRLYAFTK